MKRPQESILGRARAEGYADGRQQTRELNAMEREEAQYAAYCDGRLEGEASSRKWWLFGVLCGIGLSAIVGAFL